MFKLNWFLLRPFLCEVITLRLFLSWKIHQLYIQLANKFRFTLQRNGLFVFLIFVELFEKLTLIGCNLLI